MGASGDKYRKSANAMRTEELRGKFEGIRWKSTEPGNFYVIGHLDDGTVIKGDAGETGLLPGMEYSFHGKWGESSYGKHFDFRAFVQAEPLTRPGVVAYLRKLCPGVGDMIANKLCDLYGPERAIAVLKTDPQKVSAEIGGRFPLEKAIASSERLIKEQKWQSTKVELLGIIGGGGFRHECIDLAIGKWGVHAPSVIRRDPFAMMLEKFPGAGFLTCDKLWHKLGLPGNKMKRQVMCVWHVLRSESDGSTWLKKSQIAAGVERLVTGKVKTERAIRFAIKLGLASSETIDGEEWIAYAKVSWDEMQIAEKLAGMMAL
jgi:hypothetical protein